MKKVLFVLSELSLHSSPNALCVEYIAKELIETWKYEVDFLSLEFDNNVDNEKTGSYFVCIPKQRNDFVRKMCKFFSMPLSSVLTSAKMSDKIIALQKQNQYDAIIAVMNPPETAEAVWRAKKRNQDIHYIIYEIDSNSNRYKNPSNLFERYLTQKAMRWEEKVYNQARSVVHMISHREHYSQSFFNRFETKTYFLDIPGLNTICFEEDNQRSIPNSFLYAGAFYHGLRTPDKMILYMAAYFNANKGYMDIYTGRMHAELNKLIADSNCETSIRIHNTVDKSELNKIVHKHRVLISIGNKQSDFLPSKVLDYIGTNKQIIHFYSDKNDTSIAYLKKYKNCLLIKDDMDVHEVIEKISSFVKNENHITWKKCELKKVFMCNTPEYTAKNFKIMIDENFKKENS